MQLANSLPKDVERLTHLVCDLEQKKASHQTEYINQLIETTESIKHQCFGFCSEKFNHCGFNARFIWYEYRLNPGKRKNNCL